MRIERAEYLSRKPAKVTIEGDIATFHLSTGDEDFLLAMPVHVLLANMAACDEAIQEWQRRNGAQVAVLSKRGPLFLREGG